MVGRSSTLDYLGPLPRSHRPATPTSHPIPGDYGAEGPPRPSIIVATATPRPAESAMTIRETDLIQTITSSAMRAKTASSEPVPFVSMLLTGSRHGKTRQIEVTPDTGASSTVVSAQTAQLLLLQVDQTRMVRLEDAQGNQLQVSGIACVYGCLEMAQDIWGSFEVIVSPALTTGVLLSHMEQKNFGLIPAQWPNVCLHHQLDSKLDRVNSVH